MVAEKEAEAVKLRKDGIERDRATRKQIAQKRDMEEELGTLRTKISNATDGAKKATAQAESAMQVAREAVSKELSQVCLECPAIKTACAVATILTSCALVTFLF